MLNVACLKSVPLMNFVRFLFGNKILAIIKHIGCFYDNQNLMVPLEDKRFSPIINCRHIWIIEQTNV